MTTRFPVLTLPFLVALLGAQTEATRPLPVKAFLPDEYRLVAHADFAAMRTRGVWDELEASALNIVFQQMSKEIGFPLERLDRVTVVGDLPAPDAAEARRGTRSVMVFEGNAELPLSDRLRSWTEETVGPYQVRRSARGLCVQAGPTIRLEGDASVLQPVLDGKPHAGNPCADVMSLLSGRTDQFAYVVMDVAHPETAETRRRLFEDAQWPEGDEPTFLCLRALVLGDADDPHLGLEAVLRHAKVGPGLDASEKAADAMLTTLKDDPRLRALRPILAKVEKRRNHADLVLRADFGRVRNAIGHVALLLLPLFALQQVDTVPAVAPAPAPPKK